MLDEKLIITPDQAISLLVEGDTVHNYANPVAGMFVGVDFDRSDAEKHIREAIQCEIAGPGCKSMKHALAVWSSNDRVTFFETDMEKVEAMERELERGVA